MTISARTLPRPTAIDRLSLLLIALQATDIFTTVESLNRGAVESNPLYHAIGAQAFVAVKFAVVYVMIVFARIEPGVGTKVLKAAIALYVAVCAWNLCVIGVAA